MSIKYFLITIILIGVVSATQNLSNYGKGEYTEIKKPIDSLGSGIIDLILLAWALINLARLI